MKSKNLACAPRARTNTKANTPFTTATTQVFGARRLQDVCRTLCSGRTPLSNLAADPIMDLMISPKVLARLTVLRPFTKRNAPHSIGKPISWEMLQPLHEHLYCKTTRSDMEIQYGKRSLAWPTSVSCGLWHVLTNPQSPGPMSSSISLANEICKMLKPCLATFHCRVEDAMMCTWV